MIHTGEVSAKASKAAGAEVVVAIMSPRMCDGEPSPGIISSAMKGADLVASVALMLLVAMIMLEKLELQELSLSHQFPRVEIRD